MRNIIGNPAKILPAGEFIRTENDNAYVFNPSPLAQEYLDRIRQRYGYDIDIQPTPEGTPEAVGGFFDPDNQQGGSQDPSKRTVYLDPVSPRLAVLAHELGHAVDPTLLKEIEAGTALKQQFLKNAPPDGLGNPSEFLADYLFSMGPREKFRTELTAEEAAKTAGQELGVTDEEFEVDKVDYPLSYITKGIDEFEMHHTRPQVPQSLEGEVLAPFFASTQIFGPSGFPTTLAVDANTEFDASDDYARRVLNLALDRDYQKVKNFELNRALNYAERRLGDSTSAGDRYYPRINQYYN